MPLHPFTLAETEELCTSKQPERLSVRAVLSKPEARPSSQIAVPIIFFKTSSKASDTTSLLASSSCKMRKARKYAWEYFSLKKASKPVLFIYLFFIHSIMLLKGGGIGRFGAVKGIHFFDYLQILHIIISIWSITKRKRSHECHESFTNFFGTNIHG